MDRRRGGPSRLYSEDVEYWTRSAEALRNLAKHYSNYPPLDLVGRANRLISTWPTDDDLPGEGWKSLKENYKKLSTSLDEVRKNADAEAQLLHVALEHLEVLMALRKAPPEQITVADKRAKRAPRASSPAGTPTPGQTQSSSRGVSITLPPRTSSVGPSNKKRIHPLQGGRKVALWNSRVNPNSEEDWILAIVIRVVSSEKGKYVYVRSAVMIGNAKLILTYRYEVRDAEEQEGSQAASFTAPQKFVIPLPDPKASSLHEFPVGSTVLGLYPDTSCFYRAEVMATPKQMTALSGAKQPIYKLKFEDDDNQEHAVSAEWVVEHPHPSAPS
ncbi:hypothetical protein CC2G_012911 [Coprinopsis cinerea AmutBmut pab1-1]|nr:hypothetical protein CC2G_012911 [Coprinopsis cinerea AmutBmut pab1-1]